MNKTTKNIILIIVVAIIVVSISYLEAKKPPAIAPGSADIVLSGTDRSVIVSQKTEQYPRAKEFVNPSGFINTGPFRMADLVGNKVVLVDFWTYSCINCQRTIPYLNAWYAKYKDYGFTIVGVHTPEFNFEKDTANVTNAVRQYGIQYPVVQDNDSGTWQAYQNQYWPREYLIDIDGFIVHDHIGEGDYAGTEAAIQKALQERSNALGLNLKIPTGTVSPATAISMDPSKVASPETYFGAERNEFLGNGSAGTSGPQALFLPQSISGNTLYLDGNWNFEDQYAENTSQAAKIVYKYTAKNVYFVAAGPKGVKATILLDGAPVGARRGTDVAPDSTVTIKDDRLYDLVSGSDYGTHTLEIDIEGAGLQAFTFTFG